MKVRATFLQHWSIIGFSPRMFCDLDKRCRLIAFADRFSDPMWSLAKHLTVALWIDISMKFKSRRAWELQAHNRSIG
jgi:hypothetical protein